MGAGTEGRSRRPFLSDMESESCEDVMEPVVERRLTWRDMGEIGEGVTVRVCVRETEGLTCNALPLSWSGVTPISSMTLARSLELMPQLCGTFRSHLLWTFIPHAAGRRVCVCRKVQWSIF